IRVTVRASSRTDRYASFWRTSADRSGSISSRAVASRIVPSRCTLPSLSTSPRGRLNAYSDFSGVSGKPWLLLLDREALVAERDALHGHLVRVGLEADARVLLRPGVDDRVRDHGLAHVVEHRDLAVLARVLELPVDDHLAPLPERLVLVDAALELDVAPLRVAHDLDHVGLAVGQRPLDLGRLGLGVEARRLLEEARGLRAADLQGEPDWDVRFLVVLRRRHVCSFRSEIVRLLADFRALATAELAQAEDDELGRLHRRDADLADDLARLDDLRRVGLAVALHVEGLGGRGAE